MDRAAADSTKRFMRITPAAKTTTIVYAKGCGRKGLCRNAYGLGWTSVRLDGIGNSEMIATGESTKGNVMIVTNFRVEPASDNPSFTQIWANAASTAMNLGATGWSMVSPLNYVTALGRMNRAFAGIWLRR